MPEGRQLQSTEWLVEEVARREKVAQSYVEKAAKKGVSSVQRALLEVDAQFNRTIANKHRQTLTLAKAAGA